MLWCWGSYIRGPNNLFFSVVAFKCIKPVTECLDALCLNMCKCRFSYKGIESCQKAPKMCLKRCFFVQQLLFQDIYLIILLEKKSSINILPNIFSCVLWKKEHKWEHFWVKYLSYIFCNYCKDTT